VNPAYTHKYTNTHTHIHIGTHTHRAEQTPVVSARSKTGHRHKHTTRTSGPAAVVGRGVRSFVGVNVLSSTAPHKTVCKKRNRSHT